MFLSSKTKKEINKQNKTDIQVNQGKTKSRESRIDFLAKNKKKTKTNYKFKGVFSMSFIRGKQGKK